MSFFLDAKNACSLIAMGEWREFIFRIRVHIQKIDLKNCSLDELQLPEERCHDYANSGGLSLETVLRALKITSRDAIVDFGSGKGGALITMARYPFARIMGVEISPELVAKHILFWLDDASAPVTGQVYEITQTSFLGKP